MKREEERADDRSRQQERRVLLKDSDHFVVLGIYCQTTGYWPRQDIKIRRYIPGCYTYRNDEQKRILASSMRILTAVKLSGSLVDV